MSDKLSWGDASGNTGALSAVDEEGAVAFLSAEGWETHGSVYVDATQAESLVRWLSERLAACGRPVSKRARTEPSPEDWQELGEKIAGTIRAESPDEWRATQIAIDEFRVWLERFLPPGWGVTPAVLAGSAEVWVDDDSGPMGF